MLEHLRTEPAVPKRCVILGAGGFVGGAIVQRLQSAEAPLLALTRKQVDLLAPDAAASLADQLLPGDALVLVSALAPCRDIETLLKNLRMVEAVCTVLESIDLDQVVYISSDAVYADIADPITESSCRDPASLHGMMHSVRELMLQTAARSALAILRPSILYGATDPHNGYGPNRFRRTAAAESKITLFGNGEEQRDHVAVGDLAELVSLCLAHRAQGALNVATGQSISFLEVAELVAAQFDRDIEIIPTPRQNPITHRHFDATATLKAFPNFFPTPLPEGLARVHQEATANDA